MAQRLDIGFIGAGKVGASLAAAFHSCGHRITGISARSQESRERAELLIPQAPILLPEEIARHSAVIFMAVPDSALEGLIADLASQGAGSAGKMFIHTAGAYGVKILEPLTGSGAIGLALHPAMTFTGTSLDVNRLHGCPWAVTGPALYTPVGHALVEEIGGIAFDVEERNRTLYHAGLSHGANNAVTLIVQAMRAVEKAGIGDPGTFLRPLLYASMEGALTAGETLLTGPVVRSDVTTVRRHTDELSSLSGLEDVARTYRQLTYTTAERAYERGAIDAQTFHAFAHALSEQKELGA